MRESPVSAARTAIGDHLRSLVYFTANGHDQIYLRSDLERGADVDRSAENERLGFPSMAAYGDSELGDYRFTVRAFSRGYVVRVIAGDRGAFATTDEMPISEFEEVATAIEKVLEEAR
ncbi:hypothetical protein BRC94_08075 [Halobacteriales archaeon QS_5_70_17]|nr:MAG: hypothetical protein BRC94_08075 [Halobacteriales archaeon QS_5_70_17]